MADNTIDREIQSLLETYIPDIRDNCHECFGDGRFRHSRKEKRDAAKQGLQNLIAQEANKARIDELQQITGFSDAGGVYTKAGVGLPPQPTKDRIAQLEKETNNG